MYSTYICEHTIPISMMLYIISVFLLTQVFENKLAEVNQEQK